MNTAVLEEVRSASSSMMKLAVPSVTQATSEYLTQREVPLTNTFLNFIDNDAELNSTRSKRRSHSIISYVRHSGRGISNLYSQVAEDSATETSADNSSEKNHDTSADSSSDTVSTQSPCWFDRTSTFGSIQTDGATTVMVQNLPRLFSQKDLMNSLDLQGFEGTYDYCYLPVCFTNGHCRGYAFINFQSPLVASRLLAEWQDAKYLLSRKQKKPLVVTYAETQGLAALLAQPAMKRMQRVRNVEFRPFVAGVTAVDTVTMQS